MQPSHFDLIVVGAGVLGSFHAYHAAKKGWKVLVIEKDDKRMIRLPIPISWYLLPLVGKE